MFKGILVIFVKSGYTLKKMMTFKKLRSWNVTQFNNYLTESIRLEIRESDHIHGFTKNYFDSQISKTKRPHGEAVTIELIQYTLNALKYLPIGLKWSLIIYKCSIISLKWSLTVLKW